jgi:hypothetical protein
MKKTISLTLMFLVAACVSISCNQENNERSLNIYSPMGSVIVISGGVQKAPQDGDPLSVGDSVRTGALSTADILLGDIGIIRIYENSLVHIKTLVDPSTGDTKIDMNQGKLYSTLGKLSRGSFQVQTPTSVASIRGTSFRISAAQDDSRLDVLDGKVQINPVKDNAVIEDVKQLVEANQTINIDRATAIQAFKEKRGLRVSALKAEDLQKIREEIKTIKPEVMKKMRKETQEKLKRKMLENKEKIELMKEKREQQILDFKEKQKAIKEKRQMNKEKIKASAEQKQSVKERLNALKEKRANSQKKPLFRRNFSGK